MAYSQKEWDIVRAYYEAGLKLREIINRSDVSIKSPSQISKMANKECWEHGKKKQLIDKEVIAKQAIIEVEKEKETLKETEVKVINNLVTEQTEFIKLRNSAAAYGLRRMTKTLKEMENPEMRDYVYYQDAIGKASDNVLGKQPTTAVQNNVNVNNAIDIKSLSTDAIKQRLIELRGA